MHILNDIRKLQQHLFEILFICKINKLKISLNLDQNLYLFNLEKKQALMI